MSEPEPVPGSGPTTLTDRFSAAMGGLLIGAFMGGLTGMVALLLIAIAIGFVLPEGFHPFLAVVLGLTGGIFGAAYGGLYGMLHNALIGPDWSLFHRVACDPRIARRKLKIRLSSLGAALMLMAFLWAIQAAHPPEAVYVESITVVLRSSKERASFSVPREHIPKLLAALRPAHRDWIPAKWVGADQLKITYTDGSSATIDMYKTRSYRGAFSVQPDDRPRNWGFVSNYFRGGSDKRMAEAVKDAHEAFKIANLK